MKNKLGKRALSLLLSALMVVTSLPLVALPITAFAGSNNVDKEHLTGEYLVDGLDGVTTQGTGSISWDSAKKEVYFDGNSYDPSFGSF